MRATAAACLGLLLTLAGAPAANASFPGRNGAFAVSLQCGAAEPEHIQLLSRRGRPIRQVTPCGSNTWGPDFSPSGRRIIYTVGASVGKPARIAVARTGGGGRHVLRYGVEPSSGFQDPFQGPSFAPSGRRIVFADGRNDGEVRTGRLAGRRSHRLLDFGDAPRWSPAGGLIAVELARGPDGAIHLFDAHGGRFRGRVARTGDDPDWSPDGRQLVYAKPSGIYVVRADGRRRHALVRGRDAERSNPVWSPDGRSIAWIESLDLMPPGGDRRVAFSLWRARVNGGRPHRVTTLGGVFLEAETGADLYPPDLAWQPRPRR
jgi:Tol biopolymer transport system component